jgi:dCTP deaminase
MIEPFSEAVSGSGVISYGVSSYGYDIRVADEWKLIDPAAVGSLAGQVRMDPKAQPPYLEFTASYVDIPPNSYVLGRSVEHFRVPRDVLCVVLGKSTYARCGVIVNVTPLEPGWEGYITIEISNTTPLPARIYANEGIAQVLFFKSDNECETSYADKKGKYQGQVGVVGALVR